MPSSTIEEALQTTIRANASVLSALGGPFMWYVSAPSGQPQPYITFFMVSPDNSARTFCHERAGEHRYQFDIWANSEIQALTVGNALVNMLRFYHGSMDGVTVDWIRPFGVIVSRDDTDDALYHGIVEIDVRFLEV
jgi:hypothetical protein